MDLQPNKIDGMYLPITDTRISASEWNQLVGSCMAFITDAGLTPDAADNEQFLNAFKTIAADLELVGANTNLSNLTAAGKIICAKLSMPSTVQETLTVSTSGSSLIAPSDGYIKFEATSSSTSSYIALYGEASSRNFTSVNNSNLVVTIPVRKGAGCLYYYNNITNASIKFVYAEGSKSEAN